MQLTKQAIKTNLARRLPIHTNIRRSTERPLGVSFTSNTIKYI